MYKIVFMLAAVAATAECALAQTPDANPKSAKDCGVNLGRYMNMDPATFNDTLGKGWREVSEREGCLTAAADLIALYRTERIETWKDSLTWHEAQLRAGSGDLSGALELFETIASVRRSKAASGDPYLRADLLYADGTIALLKRDRSRLEAAQAELLKLPVPPDFKLSVEMFRKSNPSRTPPVWPVHLKELDGFLANFDKPYAEAYSAAVRNPPN